MTLLTWRFQVTAATPWNPRRDQPRRPDSLSEKPKRLGHRQRRVSVMSPRSAVSWPWPPSMPRPPPRPWSVTASARRRTPASRPPGAPVPHRAEVASPAGVGHGSRPVPGLAVSLPEPAGMPTRCPVGRVAVMAPSQFPRAGLRPVARRLCPSGLGRTASAVSAVFRSVSGSRPALPTASIPRTTVSSSAASRSESAVLSMSPWRWAVLCPLRCV